MPLKSPKSWVADMGKLSFGKYMQNDTLAERLSIANGSSMTAKDFAGETSLPPWLIKEMCDCNVIRESEPLSAQPLAMLQMAVFCMTSERFIKNSLNRLSKPRREKLSKQSGLSQLEVWVRSYMDNRYASGQMVIIERLFEEASRYFPSLAGSKSNGLKTIIGIVAKYKRIKKYERDKKRKSGQNQ